jgi:hypothetical protein
MLQDTLLKELRDIAYHPMAKPKDRISACNTLFKNSTDIPKLLETLEEIAVSNIDDSFRIKAMDLVYRIKITGQCEKSQEALDEESVKETLMEQYCGRVVGDIGEVQEPEDVPGSGQTGAGNI